MDFLVFSHLRWNFVFQRPQHLMSRFAAANRVFFWEEPVLSATVPVLNVSRTPQGVVTIVAHLPSGSSYEDQQRMEEYLLMDFIQQEQINNPLVWYYNPLAINFTRRLEASAIVYDCMDELSAFRGAPEGLRTAEAELFSRADLVFTGGRTLYEAKKKQHHSVHCFPSSIDREFFGKAREAVADPADQAGIPHPRVGFAGVIDERMDMELLESASAARRDWHFVMIGPTAKIAESELPRSSNLHWMGAKPYSQLPQYMAGWDVGLMPFARNEATRFISPTKTPEYLAAGLPVVSTSIADVVRPYGELRLVHIADDARSFVGAVQLALAERNCKQRLTATDKFLKSMSWDLTWVNMNRLVNGVAGREGMQSRTPVTAPLKSAMAAD